MSVGVNLRKNEPRWGRQKTGHSSLNGAMTPSPEGKYTDTEIMLKKCTQSDMRPRKKDKPEYIKWEYTHTANHTRSAGAMDAAGIKKILCRFVRPHGLRYTLFIGDGGTKPLDGIWKLDPYPGRLITKGECVEHVQNVMASYAEILATCTQ